jgi:hypothetical protein
MARYVLDPNDTWRRHADWNGWDVIVEVRNPVEKPNGAYRMLRDDYGWKPFKGETAWSDAERCASDIHFSRRYK